MKATTAAVLDTRYQKVSSDTFPVRLRITNNKIQKYFPTKFSMTEKEWKTMKGSRPGDLKETLLEITAIESKAAGIIDKMKTFSFDQFKKKFDLTSNGVGLVSTAFDNYIKSLSENDQVGTANSYGNAKNSIEKFRPALTFDDITPESLQQYERWMLKKDNSLTTIGWYLRCLRNLFNEAREAGEIPQAVYPFGKRKYVIPAPKGNKVALNESELSALSNCKTQPGSMTDKAKDFFLFIYNECGINVKDLCLLKYENIQSGFVVFVREKTKKSSGKIIRLPLKTDALDIIRKWGNPNKPENYIFPILTPGLNERSIKAKVRDFTCLLNKHLKQIAKDAKIKKTLTTYVARHTAFSIMYRNGFSMEVIRELAGHENLTTTQVYTGSLPGESLVAATDSLSRYKNIKTAKIVNL